MSVAVKALLFSSRNRVSSMKGDGFSLTFDLLVSEDHSWDLQVATHPVEEGSPFTDHIRQELRKGNLVGMISNHSLRRGEITTNSAQDAFDVLEKYKENAVPVTIVTTLKTYNNYLITSVKAPRSGDTGERQTFSVSFQEFRTVSLKQTGGITLINIPSLGDDDDTTQAASNADAGDQIAEDPLGTGKLKRFVNFTEFAKGLYQ